MAGNSEDIVLGDGDSGMVGVVRGSGGEVNECSHGGESILGISDRASWPEMASVAPGLGCMPITEPLATPSEMLSL